VRPGTALRIGDNVPIGVNHVEHRLWELGRQGVHPHHPQPERIPAVGTKQVQ
jgi:hypothetical protein